MPDVFLAEVRTAWDAVGSCLCVVDGPMTGGLGGWTGSESVRCDGERVRVRCSEAMRRGCEQAGSMFRVGAGRWPIFDARGAFFAPVTPQGVLGQHVRRAADASERRQATHTLDHKVQSGPEGHISPLVRRGYFTSLQLAVISGIAEAF